MRLALALSLLLAASAARAELSRDIHALLAARHLESAVVVEDVRSGKLLVNASTGAGWEAGVLPLSTTKLLLAAMAWEHEFSTRVDVRDLIVTGSDADGRALALEMRRAFGSRAMLADLARYGFARCRAAARLDCVTLSPGTSDAEWASTLSIGESDIRVSLLRLAAFLRAVGRRDDGAARALRTAMLDNVERGTGKGIGRRIAPGRRIGGKTGSGPFGRGPTDGIFAALVFDGAGRARYAVVSYVRGGGHGGGAAAEIATDAADLVIGSHP